MKHEDAPPDALPFEPLAEELLAAERLRRALDATDQDHLGGETQPTQGGEAKDRATHEDVAFARALARAYAPADLSAETHAALVDDALRKVAPVVRLVPRASRRRRWLAAGIASAGAALAVAAGMLLQVRSSASEAPEARVEPLTTQPSSRSTEPLFLGSRTAMARHGNGSARVDRIARVRDEEFLDGRLLAWGAK